MKVRSIHLLRRKVDVGVTQQTIALHNLNQPDSLLTTNVLYDINKSMTYQNINNVYVNDISTPQKLQMIVEENLFKNQRKQIEEGKIQIQIKFLYFDNFYDISNSRYAEMVKTLGSQNPLVLNIEYNELKDQTLLMSQNEPLEQQFGRFISDFQFMQKRVEQLEQKNSELV